MWRKDLLLKRRKARYRSERAHPAMQLASPIDTEVGDDDFQPSLKPCRPVRLKAAEAAKFVVAQMLAREQKAIASALGVVCELPRDLHDQRGIALKEFRPGNVSPAGRQLPEEVPSGVLPRILRARRLLVQALRWTLVVPSPPCCHYRRYRSVPHELVASPAKSTSCRVGDAAAEAKLVTAAALASVEDQCRLTAIYKKL